MASTERARRYSEVGGVMQVAAIGQHASTHTPGGSDPVSLSALGGLTRPEILALISSAQKVCSGVPDGVELLIHKGAKNGYCPLGPNKKVPLPYLPDIFSIPRIFVVEAGLPGTVVQDVVGSGGGATFFEQGIVIPVNSTLAMSKSATVPFVVASVKAMDTNRDIVIRLYIKTASGGALQTLSRYAGYNDDTLDLKILANQNTSATLVGTEALTLINIDEGDELRAQIISCGTMAEFLKVRMFFQERI